MTENDVADWVYEKAATLLGACADMGEMEKALDRVTLEARRLALKRLAQEAADRQPLACPKCHRALIVEQHRRKRTVASLFGQVTYTRGYGFCGDCQAYFFPADATMGLQERAPASPRVQEICALTTLRAPAGQAEADVRRLTGLKLGVATLHREARRQGERAIAIRDADERRTQSSKGIAELAALAITPQKPFTLVIEIDAWNIRERDNWGKTKKMLQAGQELGRWHWVYTGTIFRLDQRGKTTSDRPIITERGYVATRRGLDSFQRQLYAEALQRGFLKADTVLVLADGAVWIWNLVEDRFRDVMQRVDLHHVQQHLWNLANELHGQGTAAAQEWVRPFLQWLEKRKDGALDVINSLSQLRQTLKNITQNQRQAIDREINYFQEHKHRMDYKAGKALGQPVGSGAIESTCSQYQRRFKLTGQFWTLDGDEAFIALSTLHRNGHWHKLFPHDSG